MSNSICKFMPAKNEQFSVKTVRFVYETDFHTLRQPFISPIYCMYIVTKGEGRLTLLDREYPLEAGDVFFAFPAYSFTLQASGRFEYAYISFMGTGATALLTSLKITPSAPVHTGYGHLVDFFLSSVKRVTKENANLLTEGVLFYALSFFSKETTSSTQEEKDGSLSVIFDYVDRNYTDHSLSLSKLSEIFNYTEKHLSTLFKKHMKIGFNQYLNDLRIQYASELLEKNKGKVSDVSVAAGYIDPLYFSKVFKKKTGKTPTQWKKQILDDRMKAKKKD